MIKFFCKILTYLSFLNFYPQQCILILGASCSGKSTIAKSLLKQLDKSWRIIEVDELEEDFKFKKMECNDKILIDEVIRKGNENLKNGYNIIIDTNIYHDELYTFECKKIKLILVYAPLTFLLKRNTKRDLVLKRNEKLSYYAKKFVIDSFNRLSNLHKLKKYDLLIDTEKNNFEKNTEQVKNFILRLRSGCEGSSNVKAFSGREEIF